MNEKISLSLFVLKRSYICCCVICMTVPLKIERYFEIKRDFMKDAP